MSNRFLTRSLVVAALTLLVASMSAPALAQGTGALRGKLVDAAGNPVADAVLTFKFIGDYDLTFTAKSDAKGLWGRAGLLPGQWTLTISKGDLGASLRVQVNLGVNTAVADITLAANAAPAGRAGGPGGAPGGPSDRMVLASAIDSKGLAIKDLTKADWTVKEDGSTRTVSDAKLATEPLDIQLLVENSKWILPTLKDIAGAMNAFVSAIFAGSPESTIEVTGFGGQSTTLQAATKSAADLAAMFNKLSPNPAGSDVLLESLVDASKKLAKSPTRRRVIVIFHLESTPETSQLQPSNVVSAIVNSGAVVWTVSLRDSGQTGGAQDRDVTLSAVMPQLGGERATVNTPKAIEFQMKRVAEALLGQYVLVYGRPDGPAPKQLALAVTRSGAKVFAPKMPPGVSVMKSTMNSDEVAKHNKRQAELELLFKDGDAALTAGNLDDALAKFTAIATEMDKCATCAAKLGDVYVKKGDLDNAEKSYLKAIDLDPNGSDAYAALASLYNQQKKFDDASKMSTKANELKGATGGDANSLFNQGIILWNQSKIPEAKGYFEKAVAVDPKMADAHYWLGMAIVNEGKLAESKKSFEEYLKLAPTGQYADTAKAILATIK